MEKEKLTIKPIDKVTVERLSIALRCQGIDIPDKILDQIIDTVELLEDKGGLATIDDFSNIMLDYKTT